MIEAYGPAPAIQVAVLVCTNRQEWGAFVDYQIDKQVRHAFGVDLSITVYRDMSDAPIPYKRTDLLRRALDDRAKYLAFFDDDDWQHPTRLARSVSSMQAQPTLAAVGNIRADFVSIETRRTTRYHAPEGIIFNGAVFRTSDVPTYFEKSMSVGEDTEWLQRWQRRQPSYLIVGTPMHAWISHRQNITNRVDTRTFEEPPLALMTEEDWKRVP